MSENHTNHDALWEGTPHWLGMLGFYFKGLVGGVAISLPFFVAAYTGHFAWAFAAIILVVLWALVIGLAWIKLHTTNFKITPQLVCQSQGIFSRDWVTTPIVRLQDISVHQPFWERIIGLGTIEFDNAADRGTVSNEFLWKGVRHPRKIADLVEDIRSGAYHDRKQVIEGDEELSATHIYDDLDGEPNRSHEEKEGHGL
jgi:uncharacterized membrane protein YdbT with pleckstrin-like domain